MSIWVDVAASLIAGLTGQADLGPWAAPQGESCDRFTGKRRIAAELVPAAPRERSLRICRAAPLELAGRAAPPDYCERRGRDEIYGVWLLPDPSCTGPRL
ncbi:MAG: hypothetical protein AAFX03_14240 [Pseudomonadota bacterium]